MLLGPDGSKLSKRHGAASVADLRAAGIPAEAVRAYLEELGLPRSDVQYDPARIERLAVEAIQAMGDDELAERAGAPLRVVPAMRGARTLVEAREAAGVVLEPPEPVALPGAEQTLARFVELRLGAADDLEEGGARSIIRELKAVGGDLRALRRALTGRERGPELLGGARRASRRRGDRPRPESPWRNRATDPGVASDSMRVYSSLTRQLEELPPPPGPIRMYFCGPTVYQRIHVGNARPFVISMWLKRWLEGQGYDVVLVENITDINDKIYDAAAGLGMRSDDLAAQAADWYVEDTDLLGLGRPDYEPKASETVSRIVALIDELIERGLAYEVKGDVYFRVGAYDEYGSLSGQRPDQVEEQEPNPLKDDPRDFALWKATKPGEDTFWDSPWGRGRPGWHIECSAMAEELLGPVFEIHGGGLDLVFPHHENELAQSRGAGREFARIWMHNGMLQFTGEKMSKSVGNIVTLREAVQRWGSAALLLFFMTAHWRKPVDFSEETLAAADAQVRSLRNRLLWDVGESKTSREWNDFVEVLENDFNTPDALAIIHEWAAAGQTELLRRGLNAFGIDIEGDLHISDDVHRLARDRQAARRARDFGEADRLRDELAELGWDVRDIAEEPGYRLVPSS